MHVYLSITARVHPAEIIINAIIGGVGSGGYIYSLGTPGQRVCYKVTQLQIPCIPNPTWCSCTCTRAYVGQAIDIRHGTGLDTRVCRTN